MRVDARPGYPFLGEMWEVSKRGRLRHGGNSQVVSDAMNVGNGSRGEYFGYVLNVESK